MSVAAYAYVLRIVGNSAVNHSRTATGVPSPAFTKIAAMSAPAMTTTGCRSLLGYARWPRNEFVTRIPNCR
jgi:hypothetical protein